MQHNFCSSEDFLQRTDRLTAAFGCKVVELAAKMGVSERSIFGWRSGRNPVTRKALLKLEAAERAAGIGGPPATPPPSPGDAPAAPLPDLGELPAEVEDQLARLREQVADVQQQLSRAFAPLREFPLAELKARMKAAGAWPPSDADLRLTPAQAWAKYAPRR